MLACTAWSCVCVVIRRPFCSGFVRRGFGTGLLDHVTAVPTMRQMTYARGERMSTLGCDIRPLLRPLARSILGCAEMEQHAPTGLEFCLACGQDFVSMVRC